MKSDDKDRPGVDANGDGVSDKSKRPSRVIDLEAAEVETGTEDEAEKPDRDAGTDATSVPRTGPGAAKARAAPPRRRAKPSDIRGFVTHLAAGLAGGLIGVVGAGVALDRLPLGAPGRAAPETARAIEQFGQRLTALDARIGEQAKTVEAASQGGALKALQERLAALEGRPEPEAPVLQPLNERLEKLEATLKLLQAQGGEEGASGLARSAALTGKITEVSRELEQRISSLKEELAAAKAAFDTRAVSPGASNERLEALESRVTKLAARPAAPSAQTPSRGNGAAPALAFEILRRTIDRGAPFAAQLSALEQAAPAGLDFSALAARAGDGVPADGALLAALAPALKDARRAAARSGADTFLDRLVSNARSVVRVRRIGQAEGPGAAAVLSRMEAHMRAGDLPGVLKQGDALSGAALKSLQPWLGKARAQRAVKAKLTEIGRGLLAGLQAGPGTEKGR